MSEKSRFISLIFIMAAVALTSAMVAGWLLYEASFSEQRTRLKEMAELQAHLIESVAQHSREMYGHDREKFVVKDTLDRVFEEHHGDDRHSDATELVLARRVGDQIEFVFRHRHLYADKPIVSIPLDAQAAEPMRRALSGETGSVVALDYEGSTVLAAFEPVEGLNWGIVAKIDLAAIRAPFIQAGEISALVFAVLTMIGAFWFRRVFKPINRKIQDGEQRMSFLVSQSPAVIYTSSTEGNYCATYISDNVTEQLGHEPKDFLDDPGFWLSHIHPDDRPHITSGLEGLMERGRHLHEYRFQAKNGSYRWMRDELRVVQGQDGDPATIIGYWLDITDRKNAEENLRKAHDELELRIEERTHDLHHQITEREYAEASLREANAELENRVMERTEELQKATQEAENANQTKTQFLNNMSHELRTPLNGILGFSEMMQLKAFGPLDEKYQEYANDIHSAGQHLYEVIGDILDIAKLEEDSLTLEEEVINLKLLVTPCMNLIQRKANMGQVALSLDVPEDIPHLRADERRVKQILLNLLSNAVKFTPLKGKVSLVVRVDDCNSLLLQVTDTGGGIAHENIPKVLEPFVQVEDIMTRSHEGAGLGLPLSKHLAEMHGGSLEIDSELGKGTVVTVRFPSERIVSIV